MSYETDTINTFSALENFTSSQGYPNPGEVVIHEGADKEEQIKTTSEYLAHKIAFSEGVLELIHSDLLFELDEKVFPQTRIKWKTVSQLQSTSSQWKFNDLMIPIPKSVKKPLSKATKDFTLFDPDLFVENLNITNADHEVIEALYDTVNCFKEELYRPSLVMLGKAVEGAWIELGASLLEYAIFNEKDVEKNKSNLEKIKGQESIAKKISLVTNLYNSHHKGWFKTISSETNIRPSHLQEIQSWTDIVRESRNAIHFGVKPSAENNYEKNSMMLLASVKHLRTLYLLKEKCEKSYCFSR